MTPLKSSGHLTDYCRIKDRDSRHCLKMHKAFCLLIPERLKIIESISFCIFQAVKHASFSVHERNETVSSNVSLEFILLCFLGGTINQLPNRNTETFY